MADIIYSYMSLMEEVERFMLHNMASINYRLVNLGGKMLYVEGIKSVVSLGSDEMQFQLKKGLLKVLGEGLSINYLDKTTCTIQGDITSMVVS